MGTYRISGAALALIVLVVSCGGTSAKRGQKPGLTRDDLKVERPKGSTRGATSDRARITTPGRVRGGIAAYFNPWLNTPYAYGGTSRKGVDCSGLILNFYRDYYGKSIDRSTEGQYKASVAISQRQLRVGDLVFFQNTYKRGISHVGVYLGDGEFVHASNSGVQINRLDESYYKKHFHSYRRLAP
jgi:cell wall-associated NlpC family hydrolase